MNRSKDKHHMIISIDAENVFDKIQHHFLMKTMKKLRMKRMFLNIIKTVYNKSIANIIANEEELKGFPLKPGRRQGCPLSQLLFNILLQFSARGIRQEQKIKGTQIGKEEIILSLLVNDIILYLNTIKTP
jgi:retron-type reverse transcriptase